MKLIFALGNPGLEYTKSRHNVAWQIASWFAKESQLSDFQLKAKFQAELCEFAYDEEKVIIAKPTTYYNSVGESARKIIDFYQIAPENTLVIHDDMALNFGTLRTRFGGSDAGNNGIKSLNSHIGQDFWRLRIGTNSPLKEYIDNSSFVLQAFSKDEQALLEKTILPETTRYINTFLAGNLQPTSQSLDIQ